MKASQDDTAQNHIAPSQSLILQLKSLRDGSSATVAGHVIVRQRPGTAKGVIFLTLEDETGNSNVIVFHDFYDQNRMTVVRGYRVSCRSGMASYIWWLDPSPLSP